MTASDRLLSNSEFIGDDGPCGRLSDITVGNQPHISRTCIDLLVECQCPIGIDQNITVVGGDARSGSKGDAVQSLRRHRSNDEVTDIIEDNKPVRSRV